MRTNPALILAIAFFFFSSFPCFGIRTLRAATLEDTDGDGMPDLWEIRMGTDPEINDAAADPDNDGLTNLEEYQYGTNPFSSDSDEDGIDDGVEIQQYGTSPSLSDTDGGGRSDGEEILSGKNPLDPDDDTQIGGTLQITLQLSPRWNLISIPLYPGTSNIGPIIYPIADACEKVWSYKDETWRAYLPSQPDFSDLDTMVPGQGYWLFMKDARQLILSGSPPIKSIDLEIGWNLIGFPGSQPLNIEAALASIAGKYRHVWSYENGIWTLYIPNEPDFSDLAVMKPGLGYWISVIEPSILSLPQ